MVIMRCHQLPKPTPGPRCFQGSKPVVHTRASSAFPWWDHRTRPVVRTRHTSKQRSPYASCHGLQPPPSAARRSPASRALFLGPNHAPAQTTQHVTQQARRCPHLNPPPLTPLLMPYLAQQELAPPFALLATYVHARSPTPACVGVLVATARMPVHHRPCLCRHHVLAGASLMCRARLATLLVGCMRCGFGSRGER
jgi:hypothetical protein